MKYLRYRELKDGGYYWWLPSCSENEPEEEKHWSIVSWHPLVNEHTPKSGVFYGPLEAPIYREIPQ